MGAPHTYVRIDNRLLHGQVVQFWIPHLRVKHLVVADDMAASNPAMVSVYRMAVPKHIELTVVMVAELADILVGKGDVSTLVVLSDVFDLARARMSGFATRAVTLGNIHAAKGRVRITEAIHLTPEETEALATLCRREIKIEIQTFPGNSLRLECDDQGGVKWHKS